MNATDDFTGAADWTFDEIAATEHTLSGVPLVVGQCYWWRARACSGEPGTDCSYWTQPAAFVAADPSGGGSEGLVTLTVPDDGATGVATAPQLHWSWSGDVVDGPPGGFRVRIAQGGVVLYQNYETGSSASHHVPDATLAEGTTYTWTVAALRGDASVIHEPMGRTFTTAGTPPAAPPVPTLAAPDSGAVNVPTSVPFAWQASAGAASYRLEVATDQNFGQVQVVQTLADTSHVASLAQDQTYWWRVQACDGAGGTGVCSAWGGPRPFTTTDGEVKRYYYVRDHLGSVRATVNEAGVVVHYADYYPFGTVMPGRSMDAEAPKENYTGHELDDETGLLYAGARYYDAVIGRWLSVDPLADDFPEWSPYTYVENNPVGLVDPYGLYPTCGDNCDETYQEGNVVENQHGSWEYLGDGQWRDLNTGQVSSGADLLTAFNTMLAEQEASSANVAMLAPVVPIALAEPTPVGEALLGVAATGLLTYQAWQIFTAPSPEVLVGQPYYLPAKGTKNDPHGDSGRAEGKAERQIRELEKQLESATKKEAKKIKIKIQRIREAAKRAKKGETYHRR